MVPARSILWPTFQGLRKSLGVKSVRFSSSSSKNGAELPDTVTIIPSVESILSNANHEADTQDSLVLHLKNRHLVESITHDELYDLTAPDSTKKFNLYCGADPTAKSLHLGNLLPLMTLLHFNLRGHGVIGLVGGATGAVGDPSGRTTERTQIEDKERADNVSHIQLQLSNFLTRGVEYAKSRNYPIKSGGSIEVVNNHEWWVSIKMLDFLAHYGKYIRISAMLARDSVSARLESKQGLGFNEFTYQILQAYDFWHLFKEKKVNLQIGGNDQWGNITAGIDLISKLQKVQNKNDKSLAYGMTVPLLTTPTGEKFGKSAGNAVFIDEKLTTPFQLYQYFINIPDDSVEKLLKVFTLLPFKTIEDDIIPKHKADPGLRVAQRILAREVVDLIHGNGIGEEMAYTTGFLFPTPDQPFNDKISADKLIANLSRSGVLQTIRFDEFENIDDLKFSALLAKIMNKSKRETKTLIKSGAIYMGLDRTQFEDPEDVVLFDKDQLIDGKLMLVRSGKQNYYVVKFE